VTQKDVQVMDKMAQHWSDTDIMRFEIQNLDQTEMIEDDGIDMGCLTESDMYAISFPIVHQTGANTSSYDFCPPIPQSVGHYYQTLAHQHEWSEWYDRYCSVDPSTTMTCKEMQQDMCVHINILSRQKLKKLNTMSRFVPNTKMMDTVQRYLPLPTRVTHIIQLYMWGTITEEQYVLSCIPRPFVM
jgi:hypothetical protein